MTSPTASALLAGSVNVSDNGKADAALTADFLRLFLQRRFASGQNRHPGALLGKELAAAAPECRRLPL